ncbi:MAG: hypothetical protein ACXWTY_08735 [Methylobacter sp.]
MMNKQTPFKSKYAAYGKVLAERLRWSNPPDFIFVCVGGNAFQAAKQCNKDRDMSAMVLMADQDPKTLIWPVSGCPVVIKWDGSVSAKLVIELARCLLRSGAVSVTVWPTWEDCTKPTGYYDISKPLDQRWTPTRETIKTYYPKAVQA